MAAPEYAKGLRPDTAPDAVAFGLGWDNVEWFPFSQSGITALGKGGDTQYYHSGLVVLPEYNLAAAENAPGYIGALRIEDETNLRYAVRIPGNAGRDGSDMEVRRDENGAAWFYQSNGMVYMELSAVPGLSTGTGSAVSTVRPDGYARWYRVGENAAGKTMRVQMPENAGFWVYDSEGTVTASSVLGDSPSVTLPEGGVIAFAGDPGARFQLRFS